MCLGHHVSSSNKKNIKAAPSARLDALFSLPLLDYELTFLMLRVFQDMEEATSNCKNMHSKDPHRPASCEPLQQLSPIQGFIQSLCAAYRLHWTSRRMSSEGKCTARFTLQRSHSTTCRLFIQCFTFLLCNMSTNKHHLSLSTEELAKITRI